MTGKQVEGIWVFDINKDGSHKKLKNNQSKRLVPIHNTLLSSGLLEHHQQAKNKGHRRLFEDVSLACDGSYSSIFSKRFSWLLKQLSIKTNKTSFHSFRHNFVDALRNAEIEDSLLKAIIGHADNSVTYRYGTAVGVTKLKRAMDMVKYNLDIETTRQE